MHYTLYDSVIHFCKKDDVDYIIISNLAKIVVMSLRFKIISGLIVIILTSYFVLFYFTSVYINNKLVKEAQARVNSDMSAASEIYESNIERIAQIMQSISIRRTYHSSFKEDVDGGLNNVFRNIYLKGGLDILTLVDLDGNVIYRAHNPDKKGDNISHIGLIKSVMQNWSPAKGTIILDTNVMRNGSEALLRKALVRVQSTPKSRFTNKSAEGRGMFMAAAVPIISVTTNKRLGILFGGYLINNKSDLVDQIKTRLFQDQVYEGKDIGTATIFLDDVRVATNVKNVKGDRAIGSQLSKEVYDYVIQQGNQWGDRAFVVNDWYLTSYKPIKNPDGKIIGALYIGLLEEPFKHPQNTIILYFALAIGITGIATLILMFFITKMMMQPIENIIRVSKRIMEGDLSARCNIKPSGEIGMLCHTFDQMAESIEQQEKERQEQTRMQIVQSEKLASVGRLAAGVAHEINNPLTGVLTFAHFLKDKRAGDENDLKDIDVIIRETTRVRDIIRGLLDFARQSPPNKTMINLNETFKQLLLLVKGQKEFRNIKLIEIYDYNIPEILADKNQLQQVFLNLILNAGEAIAGEGKIIITTKFINNKITVSVSDTGCGIGEEDMNKIFDPFFTTKPVGKGTGLGLSVSYGIIEQHGGTINCESKHGEGTTFTITFPLKSS